MIYANNISRFVQKIATVGISAILLITSLGMNPIIIHAEIGEPKVKEKEVLDFEDVSVVM